MSKTIINIAIENLTVSTDTLASRIAEAVVGGTVTVFTSADARQSVLDFLVSDPRYTLRTFSSIVEGTELPAEAVEDALGDLVEDGAVETKTRRSDGVKLYKRVVVPVPGPVASEGTESRQPVPTAPASLADVIASFLRGDSRYTSRSGGAIHKAFDQDHGFYNVENALAELVRDDRVKVTRRSSDGAALYEAIDSTPVATSTPVLSDEARVLAFLRSDPRYTRRSQEAILEGTGLQRHEVDSALDRLVRATKVDCEFGHNRKAYYGVV